MTPYFATCARGLEPLLARELADLGAEGVEPGRGGVRFRGRPCAAVPREPLAAHRRARAAADPGSGGPLARRTVRRGPHHQLVRLPDARPHACGRLQRPRLGDHAFAVRRPPRQGRHLRPVPRAGRPPAERRCRAADGRIQPAHPQEPRGADASTARGTRSTSAATGRSRRSRRSTRRWRRRFSSTPAGTRPRRWSIRCAARERSASRAAWIALNRAPGLTREVVRLPGLDRLRPAALERDPRRRPPRGPQGAAAHRSSAATATPARSTSRGRTPAPRASVTPSHFSAATSALPARRRESVPAWSSATRPTASASATRRNGSLYTRPLARRSASTGPAGGCSSSPATSRLARKVGLPVRTRTPFFNGKLECQLWEFGGTRF